MSLGIFLAKFTEWDRIQMLSALLDILCRNQVQIYNFFLILSLFVIRFNYYCLIINEIQYYYKGENQLDLLISARRTRGFWRIKGQNKKSDRKRFYRFSTPNRTILEQLYG